MKRFYCISSVIVFVMLFSVLFLPGRNLTESAQINQDPQQNVPLPFLSLLLGQKTVSDIIQDVDLNDYATEAEVVTDQYGRKIALTKMMIAFKPDTTPLKFEQLLDRLNANITSSVARTRSVVVRIPQPDNLAAYYALIDQIEAESFVDFVWKGEIPKLAALPSNYQGDPPNLAELTYIDNHLAVGAHAAWNAAAAIDTNYRPMVIVADSFGQGPPANDTVNFINYGGFRTSGWEGGHGYGVLGIIAGTHGQYYTTGIYPGTIDLGVVDHPDEGSSNQLIFAEIINKLLILLINTPGNIIVNTSIGYECDGIGGDCIDISEARDIASLWVEDVRLYGLESRVLHITSAGNITIPGICDARTNSPFASVALLEGLTNGSGQPLANLMNTVVVENAVNTLVDAQAVQPIIPKCLYRDSFTGGHLSGIGTSVWSFDEANGVELEHIPGTSFSAPQVAGLAAFLWGIDQTLTPQQIKTLLMSTSESVPVVSDPACSDWAAPAPIIDTYEALLTLDKADTPTESNSPVRFSLLDFNGDSSFDENDLQEFISSCYDTSGTMTVLIEPDVPDYSRYDLNGDGWTGGSTTTAFDLDRTGSVQYGIPNITDNVTQDIEGTEVNFNEITVRDTDILCYYAYSNLYSGNQTQRKDLLYGICNKRICAEQGLPDPEVVEWDGLEWQRCDDGRRYSWEEAKTFCQELVLAGYSDWRLPTKEELKSLVVCSNGKSIPLVDWDRSLSTEVNIQQATCCNNYPDCDNYVVPTISSSFHCTPWIHWNNTEEGTWGAWAVRFDNGVSVSYDRGLRAHVRCVR